MTRDHLIAPSTRHDAPPLPLSLTLLWILAVTLFISLRALLDGNMGSVNEVDTLPFARQYADPGWIPGDWYLNQPPGYRLPFLLLFGWMIPSWGFLLTSLIGRLCSYILIASGIVLIARRLGLSLPLLLVGLFVFFYLSPKQGAAAQEWIIGGIESKTIAYGLLLLAIGLMLQARFRWAGLLLGLTASFHVLVGGWACLVTFFWLLLSREITLRPRRYWTGVLVLFLVGASFAYPLVLEELSQPSPQGSISSSYLYVFLRAPHHLNPLSWRADWWVRPLVYVLLLVLCLALLRHSQTVFRMEASWSARMGLARFTAVALVPFLFGLIIAPLDREGRFLQYYPFRLGDVMLPLSAILLFLCVLEEIRSRRARRWLVIGCLVLVGSACALQASHFYGQIQALSQFPGEGQGVDRQWEDLCSWVRRHTPREAVVVTPPASLDSFSWLAERATIAKFKLLPPSRAGIIEWHERLSDLSGEVEPWPPAPLTEDRRKNIREALDTGYAQLSTSRARDLMHKYRSQYMVTHVEHDLDLPIVYRDSRYVIYGMHPEGRS